MSAPVVTKKWVKVLHWIVSPICEPDFYPSSRRIAAIFLIYRATKLFESGNEWTTVGGIACLVAALILWFYTTAEEVTRVVHAASGLAQGASMMQFGSYGGYGYTGPMNPREDKTADE